MATHCGCQPKESETCARFSLEACIVRVEFSRSCGYLPDPRCQYPAPKRSQRRFPMLWRQKLSLALIAVFALVFSGCGHSEEEWQAKLKESQDLQNQLNAEKAA